MRPLPGGILLAGCRRRDYAFRPLTGTVELALVEAAGMGGSLPARVTAALAAALEQVGGEPPRPETVSALAVADRQFLMRQLAAELGQEESWLTARCGQCGERFDFVVHQADLPVKEAGAGYPVASVTTSLGPCRLRVPTGADQEFLAGIDDEGAACRWLVARCLTDCRDQRVEDPARAQTAAAFTPGDMGRIEAALEAVAPEVALAVQAACPECGTPQVVPLDPYLVLSQGEELLREIHLLASSYHWSEAEILALPLARRRRYLALIEQAHGLAGS